MLHLCGETSYDSNDRGKIVGKEECWELKFFFFGAKGCNLGKVCLWGRFVYVLFILFNIVYKLLKTFCLHCKNTFEAHLTFLDIKVGLCRTNLKGLFDLVLSSLA